ncbi:uncharacterized protein LOC129221042 [Uloborus diversus]|uniref:uncharacterized protein LOC129221042 n=1 Tax=Uloborus diversus TaxID=327109 RepID=UPI0024090CAA|nr:uncharacterized protein LOC129221042 [Uloborus diversus]
MSEDDSADGHELKIALPERIPSGSQISLGCFSHEPIAFKVKTDDCNTICDSGRERLSSPSNFNDENPLESFSKLPSAMPTCPIPDTTKGFMQCERNRNSSKLIESEVSESSPETLAQNSLSSFNACQPGHVEIKSERSLVEQQSSTLPPCPSSLENFMMETESKFLLPKVIEKSHSHPNAYAEGGRSAPVIAQTEEKKQTANRFPFQPFVPQKDKKDNPDLGKPFSENVVGGHPRPPMIETAPEEGPLNGSPAASGTSESASVVDKVAGDRALSSEILGVTAKTDVVMAAECSAIETQGALCNNLLKNHVNNESTKPLGKKRIKKTKKNQGKNKNQNAPKKSSCPIQENPWIDNQKTYQQNSVHDVELVSSTQETKPYSSGELVSRDNVANRTSTTSEDGVETEQPLEVQPSPTSHLPRAIMDPRMARLKRKRFDCCETMHKRIPK